MRLGSPSDLDGLIGIYELNRVKLLRDVYLWAYERSSRRYKTVRDSLPEPDIFRLKYRDALTEVVGEFVRQRIPATCDGSVSSGWTTIEPDSPNPPQSFIASLPPDKAEALDTYVKMASQWSGMVTGARDLAARIGKLRGGTGYTVQFVAFEGESHSSVQPAALSRGMHFAFDQ